MSSLPFEIKEVEPEIRKELASVWHKRKDGFLQVGPKNYLMFPKYREQAEGYYNMTLRPDDTWVVTFPRSGTTWTQEMVWLINNDVDYEGALNEKLTDRFPFLEYSLLFREEFKTEILERNNYDQKSVEIVRGMSEPGYNLVAKMKSPRHIKSHLPLSLLPPTLLNTCKVVYVARNPKDVAVSYYHFLKGKGDFADDVNFTKFWDIFQRNLVKFTPFWSHVLEAWDSRNHPNMLFLFYEDMKKDLPAVIRRTAAFLGKSLTEEQISGLTEHLSISKFRSNPSMEFSLDKLIGKSKEGMNNFFRQGESGRWREEFTPELNAKADKWIEEHEKNTDLRFQF